MWQLPVRYLLQACDTWRVLLQKRPHIVFVQNPPIFAPLVAAIYARLYGARYVIDSHTAAFISTTWQWSVGLHRLLSRRALVTIVHNASQARIVSHWGCTYRVLADPVGDFATAEDFPLSNMFNVVVVNSFDSDEPLDVVIDAARELPAVTFYITGDDRLAQPALLSNKPDNCRFTGYLPKAQYAGLLRGLVP